jgi:hypothetical protein
LGAYVEVTGLVHRLKALGWKKLLGFHHAWNENVIHQFYATLEVHAE